MLFQVDRDKWSRSLQNLCDDVNGRLNELDRLRAEANALLVAARTEAGAVVRKGLNAVNCRVDELHKQTIQIKEDLQAIPGNSFFRNCATE